MQKQITWVLVGNNHAEKFKPLGIILKSEH